MQVQPKSHSLLTVGTARIALSVLQAIGPIAQEMVVLAPSTAVTTTPQQRQAHVRLTLERCRFFLRAFLLARYWKHMSRTAPDLVPGLLQEGGRWVPDGHHEALTVSQERARLVRRNYVGRRTGRKVVSPRDKRRGQQESDKTTMATLPLVSTLTSIKMPTWTRLASTQKLRSLLAELLYIVRPLLWAHAERHSASQTNTPHAVSQLWKAWSGTLGLDVVSLAVGYQYGNNNASTQAEWHRRRLRLLLYVLRAPLWDQGVEPMMERIHVPRAPWIGKLLRAYLHDWLYYWKLYRMEEG
jgi:hypothetical protein